VCLGGAGGRVWSFCDGVGREMEKLPLTNASSRRFTPSKEIVARYMYPRPVGALRAHPSILPYRQVHATPQKKSSPSKTSRANSLAHCCHRHTTACISQGELSAASLASLRHACRAGRKRKACTKPSVFPEADPERKHPTRIMARVRLTLQKSGQRTCESRVFSCPLVIVSAAEVLKSGNHSTRMLRA
jgi:hypothetical protein